MSVPPRHALVLGVSEYPDLAEPAGVTLGARRVYQRLRDLDFQVTGPGIRPGPLVPVSVPRVVLTAGIRRLGNVVAETGGWGVLYFAGLGTTSGDPAAPEIALCPSNVAKTSPVSLSEVENLLGPAAPRVAIILDCGGQSERTYPIGAPLLNRRLRVPPLSTLACLPSTVEPGTFTELLLEAMPSAPPDEDDTDHEIGLTAETLAQRVRAAYRASVGRPPVEVDGSTTGVYTTRWSTPQGAVVEKTFVALPDTSYLVPPNAFAVGEEVWHQDFTWPDQFSISPSDEVEGLPGSNSQRYEWNAFPGQPAPYPPLPSLRWTFRRKTSSGGTPEGQIDGWLMKDPNQLLWMARPGALTGSPPRITLGPGESLEFTRVVGQAPEPGLRWVSCLGLT